MDSPPLWWITMDGDVACLRLYERHYSCYAYKDKRKRKLFVGPGEKIVLRTRAANAMFVWRKFIDDSGQQGIYCSIFRNESNHKSSELICQADDIADAVWPSCRHYTYINPKKVKSQNPGYCFYCAGWNNTGVITSKSKLIVIERSPPEVDMI
jgi:hypothetical protein